MPPKSYKAVKEKFGVCDAISSAISDIQDLASEMGSWRDNMSGTSLENTERYQQVEDAASILEDFQLDELEWPGDVDEPTIEVTQYRNKNRRAGESRAVRLENALALLYEAKAAIENTAEEEIERILRDEGPDDDMKEKLEEAKAVLQDFASEIDGATSGLEDVELPGMFG